MIAIETELSILVNRKFDIDLIETKIIDCKIEFPIYIFEYENHYQINFTSDYPEWELDSAILECFPGYEFSSDLQRGRKEIRLQIFRYQSELSTDGWGRPIENPLNETKYLIKKSKSQPEKFNPKVKILFNGEEQQYHINITGGINSITGEKGFLLFNEFNTNNVTNETEIFKDTLYKTPYEAFYSGYYKMKECVDKDFRTYVERAKKELKEQQKIPRKIIRDFIKFCNESHSEGILKHINENVVYEKRINLRTELRIEGVKDLKEYLDSPSEELCGKNYKIRSSWDIKLPQITIGVKYYLSRNNDPKTEMIEQNRWFIFLLEDSKIISIIMRN